MTDTLKGDFDLISFKVKKGDQWLDLGYEGCLRYDGAGNMSAQGMRRDLPALTANNQRKGPGGFAYWGTVTQFESEQRVEHHVTGCTSHPEWVGGIQERFYRFHENGDLDLMVRDETGQTTGILTWRRRSGTQSEL